MAEITLTNLCKRWGSFYAVDDMNLHIGDNDFVTLLGPSGCGKTTTLRMIAGLETPTSGRITIDGEVVFDSERGINIPPNKRKVGFLFQNYALWPNMTVYQNISFGLSNVKESMAVVDSEAQKVNAQLKALRKPAEMKELREAALDKNGKLNKEKYMLRLIDHFTLSQFGAKEIMGLDEAQFAGKIGELEGKLQSLFKAHADKGETLNEKFEVLKNGEILKEERKYNKEEIDLIVRRVSRIVKIGMFMDRYPSELSGGQQQRVAIARTLAPNPKVLFMDEPLSNLDAKLRLEMRSELQRLHVETGSTFIYVTHDQLEAMTLATKICLMDNGVVQQYDAPLTLYNRPNNIFCADFVGNPSINFVDAALQNASGESFEIMIFDGVKARFVPNSPVDYSLFKKQAAEEKEAIALADKQKPVEKSNKITNFNYEVPRVEGEEFLTRKEETEDDLVLGIRPEFMDTHASSGIEGIVFSAMPTGMETTLRVRIGDYLITGVVFGGSIYKIDQKLSVAFSGNNIMLFHKKSNKLIATGSLELL